MEIVALPCYLLELWTLFSINIKILFLSIVFFLIQLYLLCVSVISIQVSSLLTQWIFFPNNTFFSIDYLFWKHLLDNWLDKFGNSLRWFSRIGANGGEFDKRAIRRGRGAREWNDDGPVVLCIGWEEGGARWTSLGRAAQCCFDGVTKDRPAREQTNDRGSENKWQWLSKRERGPFVNAPHYRLLEIFHIRAPPRPPPSRVQEKLIVVLARARYPKPIPPRR